ncbi:rRNA-processing protein fcf2 [Medicago truncatula]|uniref:rRNA-processing protein fcf2 n=1 Tax=Medicago truncatula TaxID=3880 RepID=UPI001967E9E1|nr:rRNA-processing protein fcf2 [Medicago truncatula]
MLQKKPVVGLSWQPQLPIPSLSKATGDPSQTNTPSTTIWIVSLMALDAIDPKRHYKKSGSKSKALPNYFQASGNNGRKESIADELLSDQNLSAYR